MNKDKNGENTKTNADEKPVKDIVEEVLAERDAELEAEHEAEAPEQNEVELLRAQLAEESNKYLRLLAEFDNARKRNEKERLETFSNATASFISGLLPVVDTFDRALHNECSDAKYKDGVELIYTQLMTVLTKAGVSEIDCLGKPFDPLFHNAIKQVESDDYEEGMVCEVLQKGYMLKDKVIRYSMVVVVA